MSIFGEAAATFSDAWNGSSKMWGDAAGTATDVAKMVPGLGAVLPDGSDVAAKVNSMTGADKEAPGSTGNLGNKIGTVGGGILGGALGPAGAAQGAVLGSAAGGWLANKLGGGGGETGPITVPVDPSKALPVPPESPAASQAE